jgi:hypothetical protein
MASREWNVVRGAIEDLAALEAHIGNTLAPHDELGALCVVWFQRVRSMRRALVAAMLTVDARNPQHRPPDGDAGEP